MKRYNVKITTLTDLHIGSGESSFMDYIIENDEVRTLDMSTIMDSIDDVERRIRIARGLTDLPPQAKKTFLEEKGVTWKDHVLYSQKLRGGVTCKEILRFAGAGTKRFLPGSSVKGALRTALAFSLLKRSNRSVDINNVKKKFSFNSQYGDLFSPGEAKSGGSPNYDVFRALAVRDSGRLPASNLEIAAMEMLSSKQPPRQHARSGGGGGSGPPITLEVLPRGEEIPLELFIDEKLLASNEMMNNTPFKDIGSLFEMCREFTAHVVQVEKRRIPQLISLYSSLSGQQSQLQEGECIVRLGRGSGYLSMTITGALSSQDRADVIRQNFPRSNPQQFPTSAMVPKNTIHPLGWVKLSLQ